MEPQKPVKVRLRVFRYDAWCEADGESCGFGCGHITNRLDYCRFFHKRIDQTQRVKECIGAEADAMVDSREEKTPVVIGAEHILMLFHLTEQPKVIMPIAYIGIVTFEQLVEMGLCSSDFDPSRGNVLFTRTELGQALCEDILSGARIFLDRITDHQDELGLSHILTGGGIVF